jgi:hypothetical protein
MMKAFQYSACVYVMKYIHRLAVTRAAFDYLGLHVSSRSYYSMKCGLLLSVILISSVNK